MKISLPRKMVRRGVAGSASRRRGTHGERWALLREARRFGMVVEVRAVLALRAVNLEGGCR